MDAVVIYNSHKSTGKHVLNGSIVNAFEYYIAIHKFTKSEPMLILVDFDDEYLKYLKDIFESRYYDLPRFWAFAMSTMELWSFVDFSSVIDKMLVVDYGTYNSVLPLIEHERRGRKPPVIISESLNLYAKFSAKGKHYAEMPFDLGESYKMKMLLDHMVKPTESPKINLISCPSYTWNNDSSFLKELEIDGPIMLKSANGSSNIFNNFDKLTYVKTEIWDSHPRLMHEASYLGKEVEYINKTGQKDGSYYRYYDLIENGTEGRLFSEEDEVIGFFK